MARRGFGSLSASKSLGQFISYLFEHLGHRDGPFVMDIGRNDPAKEDSPRRSSTSRRWCTAWPRPACHAAIDIHCNFFFRGQKGGHDNHPVGSFAKILYRWHAYYGDSLKILYRRRKRGETILFCELPDGSTAGISEWMTDPEACLSMTCGEPRVDPDALSELGSWLDNMQAGSTFERDATKRISTTDGDDEIRSERRAAPPDTDERSGTSRGVSGTAPVVGGGTSEASGQGGHR